MKERFEANAEHCAGSLDRAIEQEIRRANAMLRHFRGIAAVVMNDALKLWTEVWEGFRDCRSCEEVLNGSGSPLSQVSERDWNMLMEKLQLIGIRIDYARRLCEGTIGSESDERREF